MMSTLVFVDTNVFAYALDRADTTKQRLAQTPSSTSTAARSW